MDASDIKTRTTKVEFGVVLLKDWVSNPFTGQEVRVVAGPLELTTAKDSFGFSPKGNETNWGIRVGTDDEGVLILGCQIRSVYWGKRKPMPGVNVWDLA